ncbi:MAG: HAMP domain-containing sensor histidine kinase [Burkholderiaceae bacterium]
MSISGSQLVPDKKRLRWILIAFFLALAVPTAILVAKSLEQLKWQAVYQYRGLASELSTRIDADLSRRARRESSRLFTDYSFYAVANSPGSNYQLRSPLAAYPVIAEIPGTIGYFQVDSRGEFSSPLLPDKPQDLVTIAPAEIILRQRLRDQILQILSDNELVTPAARSRHSTVPAPAALSDDKIARAADAAGAGKRSNADPAKEESTQLESTAPPPPASRPNTTGRPPPATPAASDRAREAPRSSNFDRLSRESASQTIGVSKSRGELRKLDELNLDQSLRQRAARRDKKPEAASSATSSGSATTAANEASPALATASQAEPTSVPPSESSSAARLSPAKRSSSLRSSDAKRSPTAAAGAALSAGAKMTTAENIVTAFENEVDPFALSRLNSGQFVLYRKAWFQGKRLVQGLLIDADQFVLDMFRPGFASSSMAPISDLTVAFGASVLTTISGTGDAQYAASRVAGSLKSDPGALRGTVLYESALSEPFNNLRLVFSVRELPTNAGSNLITWMGILLATVLGTGLYGLYRLGKRRLELASQQQDFVAAVSHELKTPLTSIRMFGEMLREGWASEEKKAIYYDFIHDESERLSRLIDNVLQLARMNRNDVEVQRQAISPAQAMDMIRSRTAATIARAGFTVTIKDYTETPSTEPDSETKILMDPDLFVQVVINLIDNALKFSAKSENRHLEISVSRHDRQFRFTVRDYGPGIAEDQIRKIFQLFYRAETELTRETVGTGIGLALVSQLVRAMHGKIDVVNKSPGAEFQVTLPRA